MHCDFDVSSPPPSFDFEATVILFLVFVKGEELVEVLPLLYVGPILILGHQVSTPPNSLYHGERPSSLVCLGRPWSPTRTPFVNHVSPTSIPRFTLLDTDGKKAGATTAR